MLVKDFLTLITSKNFEDDFFGVWLFSADGMQDYGRYTKRNFNDIHKYDDYKILTFKASSTVFLTIEK